MRCGRCGCEDIVFSNGQDKGSEKIINMAKMSFGSPDNEENNQEPSTKKECYCKKCGLSYVMGAETERKIEVAYKNKNVGELVKFQRKYRNLDIGEILDNLRKNNPDCKFIGTCLKRYHGKASHFNVPYGVTEIGYDAFFSCESLTEVIIPETVTEIGDNAFSYCDSLKSLTIPKSVTKIGRKAIFLCKSLTEVTILGDITEISESMCAYCGALSKVTIPNGVTKIGGNAFRDCKSLASIDIPNGVTEIGFGAFAGCPSTIYCEAEKKPDGWKEGWNGGDSKVVWGHKA